MENKNTTTGIALDLTKLEALARAATPGPWHNHPISDDDCYTVGLSVHAEAAKYPLIDEDHMPGMKDAEFIAAANPETVLQLIELARKASGSDYVLEQAAAACEAKIANATDWDSSYWDQAVSQCASAVRALKWRQASWSDGTAAAGTGGWQPMSTAPKDGTMVRLLVNFSDNATEDTSEPCVTIGANNFDHDGIDEWKFAGWDWQQDCFTEGAGAPVHWMPMLDGSGAIKPLADDLEQFESACQDSAFFVDLSIDESGQYSDNYTRYAYEFWKRALAQQVGAPAVDIIAFGASLIGHASETEALDGDEARAWVRERWSEWRPQNSTIGCSGTGKSVGDMPCLGCDACPRDAAPSPSAEKERDAKDSALRKINDIRDSIIGLQALNWSEHVYPLVAALDAAGYEGMGYPEARAYYGTLLERAVKAEDALAAIQSKTQGAK
jgi:hypothetical protein